ncbi:SDR family oxidoreductase [Nonomuraea sp. NPDC004297]
MERFALVTGAGRGIGAATACELGRRGYQVIVNYRSDEQSAATVVQRIEAAGGTARAVQADVCDPEQAERLVTGCPRLDALVCNANIPPPFAPLAGMTWEDFSGKVIGELAAVFHVTRQALTLMGAGGRIVYVSSLSSVLTRPGAIAHASAKAALDAFARHVAAEAGASGTSVNVVAPGAVRTEASASMRTPEVERALADHSVLGRMLDPEDVAAVIGSLVDGGFGAVTGVRIPVDGGKSVMSG